MPSDATEAKRLVGDAWFAYFDSKSTRISFFRELTGHASGDPHDEVGHPTKSPIGSPEIQAWAWYGLMSFNRAETIEMGTARRTHACEKILEALGEEVPE